MTNFSQAKLVRTIAELAQLPSEGNEVAFAGRSNAGKSSAINALTGRRRLAYVARSPGKTRLIQLFELTEACYLVDLPGYGYARVPESMRREWGRLVDGYLAQRQPLRGLMLIMDARHPLTPLDEHLLDWFAPRGLPVHVLLSKADKLSRSQALATLQRVQRALARWPIAGSVQLYSSLDRSGVAQAREVVAAWLGLPPPSAQPTNKNPRLKGEQSRGRKCLN